MFRDEVTCTRVHGHATETGDKQIHNTPDGRKVPDCGIECNGDEGVEKLPHIGILWIDQERTQSIGGRLQKETGDSARKRIENTSLDGSWQVHIDAINAVEGVVSKVVHFEGDISGNAQDTVAEEAQDTRVGGFLEDEVVGDLMHSHLR